MKKRHKVSKQGSKKLFTATASKTKKINTNPNPNPMRGGIRL